VSVEENTCPVCNFVGLRHYRSCPECEGRRNRRHVDDMAELIRALKATIETPVSPDEYEYLVERLRAMGHPHLREFLAWLDEAKAARGNANTRRYR
jgi:hypothetical protein